MDGKSNKEEYMMVVRALGLPTSHYATCPLGHIYVVGECGSPSTISKCVDCGKKIGGSLDFVKYNNSVSSESLGFNHADIFVSARKVARHYGCQVPSVFQIFRGQEEGLVSMDTELEELFLPVDVELGMRELAPYRSLLLLEDMAGLRLLQEELAKLATYMSTPGLQALLSSLMVLSMQFTGKTLPFIEDQAPVWKLPADLQDKAAELLDVITSIWRAIREGRNRDTVLKRMLSDFQKLLDPAAPDKVKAEPLKAEPLKAEPLKAEPLKAEPLKAETLKAEPLKAEPLYAQSTSAPLTGLPAKRKGGPKVGTSAYQVFVDAGYLELQWHQLKETELFKGLDPKKTAGMTGGSWRSHQHEVRKRNKGQ